MNTNANLAVPFLLLIRYKMAKKKKQAQTEVYQYRQL